MRKERAAARSGAARAACAPCTRAVARRCAARVECARRGSSGERQCRIDTARASSGVCQRENAQKSRQACACASTGMRWQAGGEGNSEIRGQAVVGRCCYVVGEEGRAELQARVGEEVGIGGRGCVRQKIREGHASRKPNTGNEVTGRRRRGRQKRDSAERQV